MEDVERFGSNRSAGDEQEHPLDFLAEDTIAKKVCCSWMGNGQLGNVDQPNTNKTTGNKIIFDWR